MRSVLTQTYSDFELPLMDDGSTDGSAEVADRVAASDERVRVLRHPGRGVAPTLAELDALASGEFVGVVDGDDRLVKTALVMCLDVLVAEPDVGVVYTQHLMIDELNQPRGLGHRSTTPYDKDRLLVEFMTLAFRLIRRSVRQISGGIDAALPAAPDYDLCLKLSEIANFRRIDEPLYLYRIHPA